MKIKNKSQNTIYLEDIDMYLPYDEEIKDIDPDILKKSKCLRSSIIAGQIEVLEYNQSERIESSVMFLKAKHDSAIKEVKTEDISFDKEDLNIEEGLDEIEVRIHGIFYDAGGYAKVNRNFAMKLHESGIKVKVDPKRSQNCLKESELALIKALANTKISKNHISIDSVIPSFGEYSSGKYRILYTTIESYTVPKQFLECCQLYDEIWITSPWSADVLRKVIDKPIYVIPAGVDDVLYTDYGSKFDFKPNIKNFVFVSVFGWAYRKGYDVLLNSYFDEFDANDDVSLLIASRYQGGSSRFHRNKIRDDINGIMRNFPNKDLPHVVRYSQTIPEIQMPQLYRAADCFILTSRGEGSCLPPVEASLCGLPVIMTNVSGQQMYLREDNAYLIEMDHLTKMRAGQMHLHYWDNQEFPDLTSASVRDRVKKAMRNVMKNKDEAVKRNKNLQNLIKQNFTWNNTANAAIKRLKEIKQEMR